MNLEAAVQFGKVSAELDSAAESGKLFHSKLEETISFCQKNGMPEDLMFQFIEAAGRRRECREKCDLARTPIDLEHADQAHHEARREFDALVSEIGKWFIK